MNLLDQMHALQIAKALGDPVRFSIYKHIVEMEEVRCGNICVETPVRAPTVSHHLKLLVDAGLIESRREGQAVYYRSIPAKLRSFTAYLKSLSPKERPSLVEASNSVTGHTNNVRKTTTRRASL